MKRFVLQSLVALLPVLLLVALYVIKDPFNVLVMVQRHLAIRWR